MWPDDYVQAYKDLQYPIHTSDLIVGYALWIGLVGGIILILIIAVKERNAERKEESELHHHREVI